jgi:hypothetical protein
MTTTNRRVQEFLQVVKRCCELTNVKLIWGKGASLAAIGEPIGELAGYFSPPKNKTPGILAVARGRPRSKWLAVLAHEFGHMSQWFFNDITWTITTMPDGRDAQDIMEDWVDGKIELDADEIADIFNRVRMCELDADSRALEYIKDYKLPVNIKVYAREIQEMDYSYRLMQRTRKWKHSKIKPGRLPTLKKI